MNHFEYLSELFKEMAKLLPECYPSIRWIGGELKLYMKHPFDDWHSWVLELSDAEKTPVDLAKEMFKQIPASGKRTGGKQ